MRSEWLISDALAMLVGKAGRWCRLGRGCAYDIGAGEGTVIQISRVLVIVWAESTRSQVSRLASITCICPARQDRQVSR